MGRYNRVTDKDLTFLREVAGAERVSTGQSELTLHSVDETYHKGFLPEVVAWPKKTDEVSRILQMANERMIPVTPGEPGQVWRGTRSLCPEGLSSTSSRWIRSYPFGPTPFKSTFNRASSTRI